MKTMIPRHLNSAKVPISFRFLSYRDPIFTVLGSAENQVVEQAFNWPGPGNYRLQVLLNFYENIGGDENVELATSLGSITFHEGNP